MKKKIFIAALLVFMVIFGNMTVFAESEDYDEDYEADYSYLNADDDEETDEDNYEDSYTDNVTYTTGNEDSEDESSYAESDVSQNSEFYNPYKYYNKEITSFFELEYYLDDNVYYCDESGRFDKEQRQKIIDLLKETSRKLGFNLAVYTGGYMRKDSATQKLAARGSETIFSRAPHNNTVFLYLDLDGFSGAYDYMDCYHEPCLYYFATADMEDDEVTRIDRILEKMQEKLPAGGHEIYFSAIYNGLQVYCQQLEYYKNLGPEEGAYYYNKDINKYVYVFAGGILESENLPRPFTHWKFFVFLSLLGGVLTATVIYMGVKSSYAFKTPASASVYTSQNKIFVINRVDQFLGSDITKTRIESSSSSSHHSRSHHSSSHHHSGGGRSGHSGGGRHR